MNSLLFIQIAILAGLFAQGASAANRACELLTAAEASSVLGAPFKAGEPTSPEPGIRLCLYGDIQRVSLGIGLAAGNGKQMLGKAKEMMFDNPGLNGSGVSPHAVAGLGDRALFADLGPGISELIVLKGDNLIQIILTGRKLDSAEDTLKGLGRKALSRL